MRFARWIGALAAALVLAGSVLFSAHPAQYAGPGSGGSAQQVLADGGGPVSPPPH